MTGATLVALIVVSGCSGVDTAEEGGTSAKESASDRVAVSEPPESTPIPAERDARRLLRPGADIDLLQSKLSVDVGELASVHVEQRSGDAEVLSYDVADADGYGGRCSGRFEEDGVRYRFVTTDDARLLATTGQGRLGRKLAGRWFEAPNAKLAEYCRGGPVGVMVRDRRAGFGWALLMDAKRIGTDLVAGRKAVQFRTSGGSATTDLWIAAEGSTARLLKLVARSKDGDVLTQRFSRFNSAGPVAPEPPADAVVPPGKTAA